MREQMFKILECEHVKKIFNSNSSISSDDKNEFIQQYKSLLNQTKGVNGVVYVFTTEKAIPRLKGHNNILYIGQTKNDMWSRYSVKNDTNTFWDVYQHAIKTYGSIHIDVYQTIDPVATERTFLKNYYSSHKELPPINRKG